MILIKNIQEVFRKCQKLRIVLKLTKIKNITKEKKFRILQKMKKIKNILESDF